MKPARSMQTDPENTLAGLPAGPGAIPDPGNQLHTLEDCTTKWRIVK